MVNSALRIWCAVAVRGLVHDGDFQSAPSPTEKKQKPKRTALPEEFPRTLIHHELDNTHCQCGCALKRIGEDVSEKLDYTPGVLPSNWAENQIRPWALGRKNWLFAGSLRSGKRAAAIMSLIQSARLNGHDPYAYLMDVLTRLPTQRASEIDQLLPHNWQPVWLRRA